MDVELITSGQGLRFANEICHIGSCVYMKAMSIRNI